MVVDNPVAAAVADPHAHGARKYLAAVGDFVVRNCDIWIILIHLLSNELEIMDANEGNRCNSSIVLRTISIASAMALPAVALT